PANDRTGPALARPARVDRPRRRFRLVTRRQRSREVDCSRPAGRADVGPRVPQRSRRPSDARRGPPPRTMSPRRLLRALRRERGYTLVEMLATLSILGVVMGGLGTLFVSATNSEADMNNRFRAQQTARVALDKMRREVHCASTATPGNANGPTSSVTLTLASFCKTLPQPLPSPLPSYC